VIALATAALARSWPGSFWEPRALTIAISPRRRICLKNAGSRESMPKFFFNVTLDGQITMDANGLDLADVETARRKAFEAAKQVMAGRADRELHNGAFLITDAAGETVLTVSFDEVLHALNRARPRNG
jgi:hypothetical protein